MQSYSSQYPDSPERLVPRLGHYLVKSNLITPAELQFALEEQKKRNTQGQQTLLGQIVIQLGFIDRVTLDRVITEQIFQMREALEHTNKALERRVQERTQELEDALTRQTELNQLKLDFIANVSHELRMPTQFLVGYLDLLAADALGPLTDAQKKAVDLLVKASQQLRKLVENITEFSNLTSDDLPVDLAPVYLEQPIHAAVHQLLPQAQSRNVELRTHLVSNLPPVAADSQRIAWVVGQLLDNAIKFTQAGGAVKIQTTARDKDATITVSDNGIGIPPEKLNQIFEPFHQLDGSMKRRHSGMGLGLALVQSILKAHGSAISVQSEPGQGSHFAFSLPYTKQEKATMMKYL